VPCGGEPGERRGPHEQPSDDQRGAGRYTMTRVIPIHELLARIRWDPQFGRGFIELGYLDHKRGALVRVPLERIRTTAEDRFGFEVLHENGTVRSIPYHRVRTVWRDGEVIWSREHG